MWRANRKDGQEAVATFAVVNFVELDESILRTLVVALLLRGPCSLQGQDSNELFIVPFSSNVDLLTKFYFFACSPPGPYELERSARVQDPFHF